MPFTPRRKNNRRANPQTPQSETKRLDGLWQDGDWWCNCEPRKKAAIREVKKNTPNKGKFFYTCPTPPYCDFFLFRDQAKTRETGLPSSSQPEAVEALPPPPPKTPTFTQRTINSFIQQTPSGRRLSSGEKQAVAAGSAPPSATAPSAGASSVSESTPTPGRNGDGFLPSSATPCPGSSKRKWDAFEESDEFSDLSSGDEKQLAELTDKSAEKFLKQAGPSAYTTPSINRTVDLTGGLPTPSVSRNLFPHSETKRQKNVSFEEPDSVGPVTPSKSTSTATAPATPSSSPSANEDITEEVMNLLRGQSVDPAVLQSVQKLLAISARKTKGIALGRESARAALAEKTDKIAKLQQRIAALENKDKTYNSQLTNIKAGLMRMYEDN